MVQKNKLVALVLAIAVFFAMMLSANMIAHEENHDCAGNDCQICQQMESLFQNLKLLTSAVLAIAFALALTYTSYRFVCCRVQPLLRGTLVALKIELLN